MSTFQRQEYGKTKIWLNSGAVIELLDDEMKDISDFITAEDLEDCKIECDEKIDELKMQIDEWVDKLEDAYDEEDSDEYMKIIQKMRDI